MEAAANTAAPKFFFFLIRFAKSFCYVFYITFKSRASLFDGPLLIQLFLQFEFFVYIILETVQNL